MRTELHCALQPYWTLKYTRVFNILVDGMAALAAQKAPVQMFQCARAFNAQLLVDPQGRLCSTHTTRSTCQEATSTGPRRLPSRCQWLPPNKMCQDPQHAPLARERG